MQFFPLTNLLSVPLAKVTDVVGKHGEVVGDVVLLAEADDDGQTDAGGGVAGPGHLGRGRGRGCGRSVHVLGDVLWKKKDFG